MGAKWRFFSCQTDFALISTVFIWFVDKHMFSEDWVGMVYLQINSQFRTQIFDFDQPNWSCHHIYIDFHMCSQKTRSGWFIYKSTVSNAHIRLLSNPTGPVNISTSISPRVLIRLGHRSGWFIYPTGPVNISTSISTSVLRRLGQDGLSMNQQSVLNVHIRFWVTQQVLSIYQR